MLFRLSRTAIPHSCIAMFVSNQYSFFYISQLPRFRDWIIIMSMIQACRKATSHASIKHMHMFLQSLLDVSLHTNPMPYCQVIVSHSSWPSLLRRSWQHSKIGILWNIRGYFLASVSTLRLWVILLHRIVGVLLILTPWSCISGLKSMLSLTLWSHVTL